MAVLKAQLTRRRLLAMGSAGLGLTLIAGGAAAGRATTGVATSLRPAGRGTSGTTCALCGDPTHTMLDGPHGLASPRRG